MPIKGPQEFFVYELCEMLTAEQTIAEALTELQGAAQNPELRQGFEQHERETRQHVENLRQAIQQMGGQPQRVTCNASEGLRQDFAAIQRQQPAPEILEMAATSAAMKTEHLEIAAYTGLVTKAQLMGRQEVAQLLQQNLRQEQAQAQRLESMAPRLGQQALASAGLAQGEQAGARM